MPIVSKCSAVQYSKVQYSAVLYSTVQYSAVLYSTVKYSVAQYNTKQHNVIQYDTVYYTIQHNVNTIQLCGCCMSRLNEEIDDIFFLLSNTGIMIYQCAR